MWKRSITRIIFAIAFSGLLAPAVQADDPAMNDARKAIRARDYAGAVTLLEPLAASGDTQAQFQLGSMYRAGQGVKPSHAKAFVLFRKAAEGGHTLAQYQLASMYEHGWGVDADHVAAREWYQIAAEAGNEQAREKMAQVRSTPSEKSLANRLCDVAARGDQDALHEMITGDVQLDEPDVSGRTALQCALERGQLEIISHLLTGGANANSDPGHHGSPLFMATELGATEAAVVLIENGANISVQNEFGQTPLHIAAKRGNRRLVDALIAEGAALNIRDLDARTALDLATLADHPAVRDRLVAAGARVPTVPTRPAIEMGTVAELAAKDQPSLFSGWPHLNIAAWRGDQETVRRLIAQGVDIDGLDTAGHSPLARAIMEEKLQVMGTLLAAGSDPWAGATPAKSAMVMAAKSSSPEILKALIAKAVTSDSEGSRFDFATRAALEAGQPEHALRLLQAQPEELASQPPPETYFLAAAAGHGELVSHFLSHGVEIDVADGAGKTAFFHAVENDHVNLAQVLLDKGASSSISSAAGQPVLANAVRSGRIDLVSAILAQGGDIDQANANGNTPLCIAARSGALDVVGLLISQGAAVDKANGRGDTPLLLIAETEHIEIARALLEAGANPNLRNRRGQRPEDLAKTKDMTDLIRPYRTKRNWLKDVF